MRPVCGVLRASVLRRAANESEGPTWLWTCGFGTPNIGLLNQFNCGM
jgi:hypothetical protein